MTSIKNINQIYFHRGAFSSLDPKIKEIGATAASTVFFIDSYFEDKINILPFDFSSYLNVFFNNTEKEPTVELIDFFTQSIFDKNIEINLIVSIGGGATLDVGKAVSNMLTNTGKAEDYQGWDLVKKPGVYKIGIPTLSGTGAESSRTCVLSNKRKNIKMGMNSHFSVYNELILDPSLTESVPFNQYFYSAMDTYIHCIESLNGKLKNVFSDSFSNSALDICKEVFDSNDPMSDKNREKIMLASYFGGVAIANSMVGIIHPFSAGLSSVFGSHHCVSNCVVMLAMEEFYPNEVKEFSSFVEKHKILIPKITEQILDESILQKLYEATIVHEKPLSNALGDNFKTILTFDKVSELFHKILS